MFLRNIVVYPLVECTPIAMLIKPSLLLLLLLLLIVLHMTDSLVSVQI